MADNKLWLDSVGDGWKPLVKEFIDFADSREYEVFINQVKEKFGGLRIYYYPCVEELEKLEDELCAKAILTCEDCGEDGETRFDIGWYKTMCDKHYREELDRINEFRSKKELE